MKAAIAWIFLASLGFAVSKGCPAPSTILPCTCEESIFHVVTCSNVTDFGSIKKLLAGKFDDFCVLMLTNVKEKTFKRGAAQALNVFQIEIVDSPMVENLASDSLMDMAKYSPIIYIINTSLTTIPTAALAKLPKLQYFYCEDSRITRILKKDFHGISINLRGTGFSGNPISNIEEGAFTGLLHLEWLDLYNCHLKTLPVGHWLPSKCIHLSLRDNDFSAIPMESLSGLKNAVIGLRRNKIRQLPSEAEMVKFFDNGNRIDLNDNPLKCSCDLKWIANYYHLHGALLPLDGDCVIEGTRYVKNLKYLTARYFSDCNSTTL